MISRDDVLRMASEADVRDCLGMLLATPDILVRFAALVAQAEREACAKVCDAIEDKAGAERGGYPEKDAFIYGKGLSAEACAAAIRARAVDQPAEQAK